MEVNRSCPILIEHFDQLLDLLLRWVLSSEGTQGNLQLLWLDCTATTSVEQIEGILNLLLLRFGQIWLISLLLLVRSVDLISLSLKVYL